MLQFWQFCVNISRGHALKAFSVLIGSVQNTLILIQPSYRQPREQNVYVISSEEAGNQNYVIDPDQFYSIDETDRPRILVPIRSVTPPPSYDELFNDK